VPSEEENKALVRRFMEARVNGDLDAVDEMLAPDFVNHNKMLPGQESDREGYLQATAEYHAALSERRLIIEDQVAGGDKVVTRLIVRAIHDRGELMGVAPSGKEVTNRGILIHRIVEGKIAEEWGMGTLATKLRGQRLEQERIKRERIEQELRVARGISKPHCPRRCQPWRAGRLLPTTSQLGRWEETSTTSST
jgi:predicted ester cyclase